MPTRVRIVSKEACPRQKKPVNILRQEKIEPCLINIMEEARFQGQAVFRMVHFFGFFGLPANYEVTDMDL